MYTSPKIYNSLPPLTQLPTNLPTSQPKHNGWAILATILAVGLAVLLLIYTGGMSSLLKLLGVGASGVYEISLTSTNDWLGLGNKNWLIGGANMNGTNVFAQFSAVPGDIDLTDKGKGFVTSIFSSPGDPLAEQYQIHEYTSPVVDLGSLSPYLSAIQITDYNPAGAEINYAYRFASSVAGLNSQEFMPLDLTVTNSESNGIQVRAGIIEQTVSQYIQIKFALLNNIATERSAVYNVNFQYKEKAEVIDVSELSTSNQLIDREITVQYESMNAPMSAEINILSGSLENAIVYSANDINLSDGRLAFSLQTALASNQAYALTISAPLIETKIIPFMVGQKTVIKLQAGSFEMSTGSLTGTDLNGDGVVNSIDYLLQYKQLETQ